MEVKLKVAQGKNAGQLLPVAGPRFLVGRGDRCHLRPRSDAVAPEQCAIELEPAQVLIRDLAGNGATLINGVALTGSKELKHGDQLKIGPLEFEVQMTTGLASKKAPKVQSPEEAANRLAAGRKKELDVSSWLDEPAEEEAEVPQARSVKMSDEERAALGLLTPGELKALQAKQAAAAKSNAGSDVAADQKAAETLSKLLKKK